LCEDDYVHDAPGSDDVMLIHVDLGSEGAYTHIHTHTYMCTLSKIPPTMCLHACKYTYTYTYVHTYTHTGRRRIDVAKKKRKTDIIRTHTHTYINTA
jgi:hypothetical protein